MEHDPFADVMRPAASPRASEREIDPSIVAASSDRPAEAAVIGALLRDDRLIDDAADKLRAEDFSDYLFADVFSTILGMAANSEVASAITVARRLSSDAELTERGGAKYLAQLAAADNVERGLGYIDHLVELSRRRMMATALAEVRPAVVDTGIPLADTVGRLESAMSSILLASTSRPAIGLAQAWDSTIETIRAVGEGRQTRGAQVAGFAEWNDLTGGMAAGQLILLGGRPGMGKTSVAIKVALAAAEAGHGVLFISREMPVEQLMMRIIADMLFAEGSSATFDDVLNGKLSKHDFERAAAIRRMIDSWPLKFEEPSHLPAGAIGPMVRRHKREMAARGVKLVLVVVDYLGLVSAPNRRSNREQEVSDISREMKSVARTTGTAMLALSQLSRALESRDDKRPVLSDLRDSGSLEQDADIVVFAYRAEYYLKASEPSKTTGKKREAWEIDMNAERDRLELHAAKVRQGEAHRRKMYFFASRQAVRSADFYRNGGGGGFL